MQNKGFLSCPAGGDRSAGGVIAAVGGGDGDSVGVIATFGDISRQEADQ